MANLSQSFKKDLTVGLILTLLVCRKRGAGVPGYGVPGVENTSCGKHWVWKTRGVENTGCGKHGVWKTRGVENTGSGGKHGVWWKTRGLVENTRPGAKHEVSVENTRSK